MIPETNILTLSIANMYNKIINFIFTLCTNYHLSYR